MLVSISSVPCAAGCCTVSSYLRPQHTDARVWQQVFVEQEYSFITQLGDWKPATVLDAGGNIGLASALFALLYPNATIVAVEPDPANFKMLELNTMRYGNVHRINTGLWSKKTGLAFTPLPCTGPTTTCGSWGIAVNEVDDEQAQLKATTVPALLQEHNLTSFDFLKIDIEGSEKAVFNSEASLEWIRKAHVLMVETHDFATSGTEDAVLTRMNSENFAKQQHHQFVTFVLPSLLSTTA